MEYPFVYTPWAVQYIIQHLLRNPGGIQEWGKCLHLLVYGVVEHCASQNATSGWSSSTYSCLLRIVIKGCSFELPV